MHNCSRASESCESLCKVDAVHYLKELVNDSSHELVLALFSLAALVNILSENDIARLTVRESILNVLVGQLKAAVENPGNSMMRIIPFEKTGEIF